MHGLLFDWNIKKVYGNGKSATSFLNVMSQDPYRMMVLLTIGSHADSDGRAHPSMDTIKFHAANGNQNIAIRAKKWLLEHQAMVLVPRQHRQKPAELAIDPRHHVYQLTGYIVYEREVYTYLYLNDDDFKESSRIQDVLREMGVPTIEQVISSLKEKEKERAKQQAELSAAEKKKRDAEIKSRIESSKGKKANDDNGKQTEEEAEAKQLSLTIHDGVNYLEGGNGSQESKNESSDDADEPISDSIIHDFPPQAGQTIHDVMIHDGVKLSYSSSKVTPVKDNKRMHHYPADNDADSNQSESSKPEREVHFDDPLEKPLQPQSDGDDEYKPFGEPPDISGRYKAEVKKHIRAIRDLIRVGVPELEAAYPLTEGMAKMLTNNAPKSDKHWGDYNVDPPMSREEVVMMIKWWKQSKPGMDFPRGGLSLNTACSEFRTWMRMRKPKKTVKKIEIPDFDDRIWG